MMTTRVWDQLHVMALLMITPNFSSRIDKIWMDLKIKCRLLLSSVMTLLFLIDREIEDYFFEIFTY